MDYILTLIALVLVFGIGYVFEDEKEYYVVMTLFLASAGLVIGHFLEEIFIYAILLLLGILIETMHIKYKWLKTKKPKSADYKPAHDWLMKIISTLIIIFSINLVSEIHMLYSFLAFFAGTIASWLIKKLKAFCLR